MAAFAQILKTATFSTLAALLFAPYLSDLHTVMLGLIIFYLNLVRMT